MISERMRVMSHRSRARVVGTVATLTAAEWEQTLLDFNRMCAYCLVQPATILEHFLPVAITGTHVNNCVPACVTCNKKKRDHVGERLVEMFDLPTIERIQAYLASRVPSGIDEIALRSPRPVNLAQTPADCYYQPLSEAAKRLNIKDHTLRYHINRLSIETHKFLFDPYKYITVTDIERIKTSRQKRTRRTPDQI